MPDTSVAVTRKALIALLNEDLAREFQAVIAYVVYSQTLKGAQYMSIAKELEGHAAQELQHAMTIAKQIDYLGGMPAETMSAWFSSSAACLASSPAIFIYSAPFKTWEYTT